MKQFKSGMSKQELVALGYAVQAIRNKATKAVVREAMEAYTELRLSNLKNDGRAGVKFEVEFRYLVNPRTTQIVAQPAGKADVIKYNRKNGKQILIEAKTGGGKIAYRIDPNAPIEDCFVSDFYAFNPFYYDHYNMGETRIFTREAFITFLKGSNGKWFSYKITNGIYDLAIQNFRIQKGRKTNARNEYFKNMSEYCKINDGCYTIGEFMQAID